MYFMNYLSSFPDDAAEFNQVNTALISIFKIDARGIVVSNICLTLLVFSLQLVKV